ncbi:MAG: hypothetical protein ABI729_01970 [Chitinophagales bacterium]
MKTWKDLFVKTEEDAAHKDSGSEFLSFPVDNSGIRKNQHPSGIAPEMMNDPVVNEVLQVYLKGLESINMPGYDFYEFYIAISNTGFDNEQAYNMAFQMARTMDKTVTAQKLIADAEFYVSKINEVHGQYVTTGQQKLNGIQEKKSADKNSLKVEIDQAAMRLSQLRSELQQLESDTNEKRTALTKIDEGFAPQENAIREKLSANDLAHKLSIDKLSTVKFGIQKYIKNT